jgi:hypothetical protein
MACKSRREEEIYKRTVTLGKEGNGQLKLAVNSFIEELKSLRILRHESRHAKYEESLTWTSIVGIGDMGATPRYSTFLEKSQSYWMHGSVTA